nr:hypothetical protein [uncultured Methanoregula sp.]
MKTLPAVEYCISPALLLAGALLFLGLFAVPAAANPPSAMSLAYDPAVSVLSVTITHPPLGMNGHYIKEVAVSVNGNLVNDSVYTGQPSDTFTYTYPLALRPGDVAEVTATCSLSGSATRTYAMPAAGTPSSQASQPAAPTPKASAAIIPVAAGVGIALALWRRI